jgi:centrosomal protein CEP19
MTSIQPLKLGLRFDPAALVLVYKDDATKKLRRRVIPTRNIDILTDIKVFTKTFRMNDKYKKYFENISEKRVEKVLFLLQDHLKGYSLKESISRFKKVEEKVVKKDSDDDDEDESDDGDFEDEEEEEEDVKKRKQGKIETYNVDDEDFSF